ncbi:MAG: response regulator [Thermodesulforhabdaceae bacterium]
MIESCILVGQQFFNEHEMDFFRTQCENLGYGGEIKAIFAKVVKKNIDVFEELLNFRFDSENYQVPCWIWGDGVAPFTSILWPKSPRDEISIKWDPKLCKRWIDNISKGAFHSPLFSRSHEGRLNNISAFEILMTIGINNVSGTLSVVRSDGANAQFRIEKGCLRHAWSREIEGVDALYDFISWRNGVYVWEVSFSSEPSKSLDFVSPVPILQILYDYKELLKENVHIFKLIESFSTIIELKPSHCALDDPADPLFNHYHRICNILSKQNMSIDALFQLSTVSPIQTLFFVNRIISLGDAVPISTSEEESHTYIASIDSISDVTPQRPYRTLIVDDAPFFLKVFKRMVEGDSRFEVVATAKDGIECLERLDEQDFDIITLDLEMPRLDGLSTLKRIMIQNPKPVVVLSAFTGESSRMTYDAFKFGAVDVIEKPKNFSVQDLEQNTKNILEHLSRAAKIQLEEVRYIRKSKESIASKDEKVPISKSECVQSHDRIFVNVFGAGSFSHFIKALFMLDTVNLNDGLIFAVPVRFDALKELIAYIQADCDKTVELIGYNPITLIKGHYYVCSQDRPVAFFSTPDGVSVRISEDPLIESKGVLQSLIDSTLRIFGSNIVLSGISGNEEDADVFEQCARKGIPVFYLDPQKCLYAGLSVKLRESGIGTEVKGLDSLIEMWKKYLSPI